jgi:LPS-assembly lipoprotein
MWWSDRPSTPSMRGHGVVAPGVDSRIAGHLRVARLAALVACLLLAACGFHLRGQASYPFRTIYVNAPAYGTFATELRRALAGSGTATVSDAPAGAEAIIDITEVADDKQVLSLSPGGRVQEYALAKAVRFRVHDAQGRDWLKQDEIVVRRNYTYDDTERLAREIQEARLLRDMQSDAIAQIVRRLQTARPPA